MAKTVSKSRTARSTGSSKTSRTAKAAKPARAAKAAKPARTVKKTTKSAAKPAKPTAKKAKPPVKTTKKTVKTTKTAKTAAKPARPAPKKPAKAAAKPAKPAAKQPAKSAKPAPAKAKPAPVKAKAAPAKPKAAPAKVAPAKVAAAPAAKPAAPKADKPAKEKPAKLAFAAGDYVVYPTHGVGKVTDVVTEEIAGFKLQLFVIEFAAEKMTLRVPVNKAAESGLRKISSRDKMQTAIGTLRGRARAKRTMWSRRAQEYEAKINSGDPVSIAEVVRDLHRGPEQPDQSYSERQMYEAALNRLANEMALVEKIEMEAATERLETLLLRAA